MVTEGNYTYHCDELVMYKILNHCVVYLKLIHQCKLRVQIRLFLLFYK